MRQIVIIISLALLLFLAVTFTANAAWPDGAQGDQYTAVNSAMEGAAAAAGISPETFIAIYNTAVAGGDLSQFTDAQLAAACSVMSSLSAYSSVLTDYNTVYERLGCSTRVGVAGVGVRGQLPSTGITALVMVAAGMLIVGVPLLARRHRRAD